MNKIGKNFTSIEQVQNKYLPKSNKSLSSYSDKVTPFSEVLSEKVEEKIGNSSEVHFSKHAATRLMERQIELSPEQSERLSNGVKQADAKGINDSLVLVDSLAFIVNVPTQTVVTAMDEKNTTDNNVFTNIDGAVIA